MYIFLKNGAKVSFKTTDYKFDKCYLEESQILQLKQFKNKIILYTVHFKEHLQSRIDISKDRIQ